LSHRNKIKIIPETGQISGGSFSKSNIVQLLRMFSQDEMREFEKFIRSPFHNNRSDVIRYFEMLRKFYPEFTHKDFTKEKIYSMLYPSEQYKDDVMRRLSSNLFKLGEKFAAQLISGKNEFNYEKNLLDFYSIKNEDKFFRRHLEKIEKQFEEQDLRDSEYFYRKSMINEIERKYMQKDDPTFKKSGYEKQIINLWKFTLSELLRLYGFAEYEIYFFNKKYDLKYMEPLLKIAESSDFMGSKTVEIYYLCLKLYGENKSDEIFSRLKDLIEQNISAYNKAECFNFYIHLINYCNISELETGKSYTNPKFQIAKKMVEYDLLAPDGFVDPGWFRGIFFMAFNAGEIKFAGEFIEKYKVCIAGKDSENVVNHAYAQIAIHKKDYDAALKFLELATYQHINDKWMIKNMYLKIFYETDKYDEFCYYTDSLKHLIKEEGSWNENLITPIRNFMNLSTKLFRLKLGEIKLPHGELKQEILKSSKIIGRKWLLEKIEELKNANPDRIANPVRDA
jgi:hypothetical protein